MRLKDAVSVLVTHYNHPGTIRVDKDEYFCLNDLNSFFPNKRMQHWLENKETAEFIALVERDLISRDSGYLESAIIRKRGKFGGTYAH